MEDNLIEYIFNRTNELCLSDLRCKNVLCKYMEYIVAIDDDMFSIVAWKKAYFYFTGSCIEAETIKEVKLAFQKWVV